MYSNLWPVHGDHEHQFRHQQNKIQPSYNQPQWCEIVKLTTRTLFSLLNILICYLKGRESPLLSHPRFLTSSLSLSSTRPPMERLGCRPTSIPTSPIKYLSFFRQTSCLTSLLNIRIETLS